MRMTDSDDRRRERRRALLKTNTKLPPAAYAAFALSVLAMCVVCAV
jgi:hypothetical protein